VDVDRDGPDTDSQGTEEAEESCEWIDSHTVLCVFSRRLVISIPPLDCRKHQGGSDDHCRRDDD